MYNLLRFIKINQFLLLFILIEGFSVWLLLKNNSYQAHKAITFSTQYTSAIHNYAYLFSDYLALKETNNYLIEENAKLHSLLKNETSFIDSTLIRDKQYNYLPAKIIKSSVSKRNNFITLNKGSIHGIRKGMGVVTKQGVIGVIHSVSLQYAIAISLLHRRSAIGVQLKKNNHNGILKWKGFNYRVATISDFPNHIPISLGDTITSNSHSVIFPEGINIGTIKTIQKNKDDGFLNVNINLFEDFNQLNYVYIIHSDETEEQLKIEKEIKRDE
ncbi:rod shape-determining protein MreC [Flavobacteriales bacterium]|nr:rod shape-determining protein MreC [Flavobacteriales bacterium]